MIKRFFLPFLVLFTVLSFEIPAQASEVETDVIIVIDGNSLSVGYEDIPGDLPMDPLGGMEAVDIVGSTTGTANDTGLAKGNSFVIDTSVTLLETEFWLQFQDSQTLTFYVFESQVEYGDYQDIHRHSRVVTGNGLGWYSSGAMNVNLLAGRHYIIALSWTGTLTYFFGFGGSQETTFGSQTHGFATGTDPLPSTINSEIDDYAIYFQRLVTDYATPTEKSTWGGVKALFR